MLRPGWWFASHLKHVDGGCISHPVRVIPINFRPNHHQHRLNPTLALPSSFLAAWSSSSHIWCCRRGRKSSEKKVIKVRGRRREGKTERKRHRSTFVKSITSENEASRRRRSRKKTQFPFIFLLSQHFFVPHRVICEMLEWALKSLSMLLIRWLNSSRGTVERVFWHVLNSPPPSSLLKAARSIRQRQSTIEGGEWKSQDYMALFSG